MISNQPLCVVISQSHRTMALFVFQLKCHQYWPIDEGHTVVYGNIRVHMRSQNHSEAWIERIMHVQHSEVSQTFIERFSYDLEMKVGDLHFPTLVFAIR